MGQLITKLFSLIGLIAFFICLIGIPYYVVMHIKDIGLITANKMAQMMQRAEATDITINSRYGTYLGRMDNTGLSIAIVDVDLASSFKVKNNFNVYSTVKPYEPDKQLLLVTIIVQNNSDLTNKVDNCMIPSVNDFKLVSTNKTYHIDIIAMQELSTYGKCKPTPLVLKNVQQSEIMIIAFDVDDNIDLNQYMLRFGNEFSRDAYIDLPLY